MTTRHDFLGIFVALLVTVLVGTFILGAGSALTMPIVILCYGLVGITIAWLIGVGYEKLKSLRSVNLHSIDHEGHQYLLVQMRDHLTVIDAARISSPFTTLSPSGQNPPRVIEGSEDRFGGLDLQTLFPPLPRIEISNDADFARNYLNN